VLSFKNAFFQKILTSDVSTSPNVGKLKLIKWKEKSAFTITGLVLHLLGAAAAATTPDSRGYCPDFDPPTGGFYGLECYQELEAQWGDDVQYFNLYSRRTSELQSHIMPQMSWSLFLDSQEDFPYTPSLKKGSLINYGVYFLSLQNYKFPV